MRVAIMFSVALLVGCSSSESKSDDPVVRCQSLISSYCDRAIACLESDVAGHAADVDECKTGLYKVVPCSQATGTSNNYDTCVSDAKSLNCDTAKEKAARGETLLPTSCTSVITFPATATQGLPFSIISRQPSED